MRDRAYRGLIASGITPAQAIGVLTADSLAARVPQTDAVLAVRARWRRFVIADSLYALPLPLARADIDWLATHRADLAARRREAERSVTRPQIVFLGLLGVAAVVYFYPVIAYFVPGIGGF